MRLNGSLVAMTSVILALSLVQVVGATSNLIIQNVDSSKDPRCCYTVVGEVYNGGPDESYHARVTAIFYDAAGYVVYAGSTLTSNPSIPVGQSARFEILITNAPQLATEIASYELTVSSS